MNPDSTITEIIQQGGTVVYILLGLSLLSVFFFFYCLFMLRRRALFPAELVKIATSLRSEAECPAAEESCKRIGGPLAEILLTVLMSRSLGREEAETLVEGAGRRAAHAIGFGVSALEVIAAISPLLGLLGTVTGMYDVFARISQVGSQEVHKLSGGIAEALVTTIVGLIVAIPTYVAHSYFSRKVEDLVLEMERLAVGLMLRVRG